MAQTKEAPKMAEKTEAEILEMLQYLPAMLKALKGLATSSWATKDAAKVAAVRAAVVALCDEALDIRKTFDEKGWDMKEMYGDVFAKIERIRKATVKEAKEVKEEAKPNPFAAL